MTWARSRRCSCWSTTGLTGCNSASPTTEETRRYGKDTGSPRSSRPSGRRAVDQREGAGASGRCGRLRQGVPEGEVPLGEGVAEAPARLPGEAGRGRSRRKRTRQGMGRLARRALMRKDIGLVALLAQVEPAARAVEETAQALVLAQEEQKSAIRAATEE